MIRSECSILVVVLCAAICAAVNFLLVVVLYCERKNSGNGEINVVNRNCNIPQNHYITKVLIISIMHYHKTLTVH